MGTPPVAGTYNIGRNDHSRIFHLSGGDHTTVEHSAIYIGPGLDVPILLTSDWEGWATDAVFRENTFRAERTARYGHGLKHEDGTYDLEPGWGGATGIEFEGNRYIGRHMDRPQDAKAEEGGSPAPKLDWNAPEFDPSRPDDSTWFPVAPAEFTVPSWLIIAPCPRPEASTVKIPGAAVVTGTVDRVRNLSLGGDLNLR